MTRVLLIPSVGAWSFVITGGQLPYTFLFPASAKEGEITFTAQNGGGSSPFDPEGGIGTVVIDGGAPLMHL